MAIATLLTPEAVLSGLKANGKKQLLLELAAAAARLTGLHERVIFETLLQRERLGSTGIGQGIAIPHGRLGGLNELFGLFARLAKPIEFESVDNQPVDIVFLLLAPEGAGADHLQALAKVARILRMPNIIQTLRQTDDPAALFAILTTQAPPRAA